MIVNTTMRVTDPGRRTLLEAGSVMSTFLALGCSGRRCANDHEDATPDCFIHRSGALVLA
jgi:hypothetical protein